MVGQEDSAGNPGLALGRPITSGAGLADRYVAAASFAHGAVATRLDIPTIVLFLAGLGLLVLGAEWLVRGASRLAAAAGVSPLVIGLTVVAFGTSSPELAVSVKAAWAGQADMAVGNVVGSNIFNILLILGVAGVIAPMMMEAKLFKVDLPAMVGLALLVPLLSWRKRQLGRAGGLILFAIYVAYNFNLFFNWV